MRYTKQDVTFHSEMWREGHPAVNVKVHGFPSLDEVVEEFHCSDGTAERALESAFEMHSQCFWEDTIETSELDFYFPGYGAKGSSEGRSGGWLVVEGLPDVETWDAVMLMRWRRFELSMEREVKYQCSREVVFDSIKCNEWALDQEAIQYEVGKCLDLLNGKGD